MKKLKNCLISKDPSSNEVLNVDIYVENGTIYKISEIKEELAVDEEIDIRGDLVLAGGIDAHVHFDDPGYTDREDFEHGTMSAAAGGVTTIIDMPCTSIPPVISAEILKSKLKAISQNAYIDFAFWGGVTPNLIESGMFKKNLVDLKEEGVAGIKVYTVSSMTTYPRLDTKQMVILFEAARNSNLIIGVHAEDPFLVEYYSNKIMREGRQDPLAWKDGRTYDAEPLAIMTIVALTKREKNKLHIVHLSTKEGLKVIKEAKKEGVDITCETCPQYLLLDKNDLEKLGSLVKTAPPLRTKEDRDALWEGLSDSSIDFITTDHAPGIFPFEKAQDNIWRAYSGIPGVELRIPLMIHYGIYEKRLTLGKLQELLSTNPAKRYGLYPKKGVIKENSDADFVVIDLKREMTVDKNKLHSKNKYTPFEGRTLKGKISKTFLKGELIYDENLDIIQEKKGFGKFLKCSY